MRLWHYKMIKYLPDMQLKGQWRELNSIFKAGKEAINHILINYIKEYPDGDLYYYTCLVADEMERRGFHIRNTDNVNNYFKGSINVDNFTAWTPGCADIVPFKNHHTDRYLFQCFSNLQEKYDRGQKDFDKEKYERLEEFVKNEIKRSL